MAGKNFQVTIDFLGNISDLQGKLKQVTGEINKIGSTSGGMQVQKQFDQLTQSIQNLQAKAKQPITSQGEFNKLIQEVNKAEGSYNSLIGTLDRLYGLSDSKKLELIPKSEQARIKSAEEAVKKYTNIIEKASQKSREFKDVQNQIANQKGIRKTAEAEMSSYTAQLEEARNKLKELQQQETELATQLAQARINRDSVRSGSGKESEEYKQSAIAVSELVAKQKALKGQIDAANNSVKTLGESFRSASERATTAAETIKQLNANKKELNSSELIQLQTAFDQLKVKAKELGVNLQGINDVSNVNTLIQRMQQLKGEGLEQADMAIEKMANSANNLLNPALQRLKESAHSNVDAFEAFNRAQRDLESLKSRAGYFFSMTNSLMLLRRALTSALNTVKELDAVMTETAVVTDFTIGDMWEKLPEYSDKASALGASIKDLYAATTLYYQQGLKTNEAMGVGAETMKMARIANMEASDATQAMTAALRGFNMEVNEMNAQKVNDVYSELAAITAADTSQIATAMSKTASIAASANMEFETTAALLAQIIETTQEAPETAGTAMKTIIARFTEVKKLFSEGQLTGEDEEGEAIEINKIDTALRSVGISLKDFLNGSKGIDDIFLELASKWDSLDLATQRYIATMAAGSRQQSRFIAMMSNYDRTMELVTAANDSAGASQEQFNKTLDSMEAKLQKMHNAWNEFTMGLADNQILKAGVDILTGLVNAINKITDGLSGGNGVVKSILNLGVALMGLKAGGAVLSGVLASIGSFQTGNGFNLGKNVKTGFANAFSGMKNIKPNIPKIDFDTAGLKAYQASLASVQASLNQVKIAQKEYTIAIWQTEMASGSDAEVQNAKVLLNQAEATSKQQVATAATQLAAATGLENEQAKEAVLLNSQGLALEWSVAAAKAGVTAAELKEIAVKQLGTGATEAAVAAKMKEILAQKGVYVAINTGILGRIEEIAMTKLGIFSTLAKVAADKLETAGLKAKTAAMWASLGVIGLIIAAVALLTAGIVALYKHAQSTSLEGRMEAAAEATTKAKEAAEGAKSAYDELLNTKQQYSDLQETLDNLVEGTNEWKKALVEANNQVLQLLENYPELTRFLTRGEDGQLIITEDGWNYIENEKINAIQDSQQNYYAKQSDEIDLQKEKLSQTTLSGGEFFRILQNSYQSSGYGNVDQAYQFATWNAEEIYNKLAELNRSDSDVTTDDIIKVLQEYWPVTLDESTAEKLFNTVSTNQARTDVLNTEKDMLLEEQLRVSGKELNLNNKQMDMLGAVSQDYVDQVTEEIAAGIKEKGVTADQKRKYANMNNYTYDEITGEFKDDKNNVIKVTNDMVASGIALTQALDQIAGEVGGIANKFNLKNEQDKIAYDLLTNQGLGLTENEAGKITSDNFTEYFDKNDEDTKKLAEFMGITIDENGEWYKTFQTKILEMADAVERRFGEIEENKYTQANYNAINGLANNQLTLNQAENLQQQIAQAQSKGLGTELVSVYSEVLSNVDESNIPEVIDELLYIDPSDTNTIESTMQSLAEQGLISSKNVDVLTARIIELAGASRKVNFDSAIEQLKESEDLIKDLKEREEHERTFNTQGKEALVARGANEADFVMTGADEWTYVGGTMESLIGAVEANTAALLGDTKATITEEADAARAWEAGVDNKGSFIGYKGEITSGEEIFSLIASGRENASNFNNGLITLMEDYGLSTEGLTDLSNPEQADAANKIITEAFNKYGTETQRQAIYDEEEKVISQTNQLKMSDMSGQEILSSTEYTNEEKQKSLDAKINTDTTASNIYEELKETDISPKYTDTALKSLATDSANAAKSQDKLNNALDENIDAFKNSKKGTEAYENALNKITDAAKEAFGDNITEDFVEEHSELFAQLAEGGETAQTAYEQLGALVAEDYVNSLNKGISGTEAINAAMAGIPSNLEIGAEFDATQAINNLVALGLTASEAAAVLEGMGYEVVYETQYASNINPGMLSAPNARTGHTIPVQVAVGMKKSAEGTGFTPSSGGGGGGGGSDKTWENPYDKLYNLTREINEELRKRERIERRYDKLLESRELTVSGLVNLAKENITQLKQEAELQKELIAGRTQQINEIIAENPNMSQYFGVTYDTNGEAIIRIDWDAINAVTDTEQGEQIEEILGKVEDWTGEIEDANDTLYDIEDTIIDIYERYEDEYFDFETRVMEAVLKSYQDQIDEMSNINDSINDTNSRLLDAVQRSIDEQRQTRENAKTEEELADKRSRLAYLQQDTSGANDLEILKLQEEIAQGEEDYTDSLIDQKISELQQQNDEAALQREQQISIAQAQLDFAEQNGQLWNQVFGLMQNGIDNNGIIIGSDLDVLLKKADGFEGMSTLAKLEYIETINEQIGKIEEYLQVGRQLEALQTPEGTSVTFTTADGKTLTGTVDAQGNVVTKDGFKFEDVYQTYDGSYKTFENSSSAKNINSNPQVSAPAPAPAAPQWDYTYGKISDYTGYLQMDSQGNSVKALQSALNQLGFRAGEVDGYFGYNTESALRQFQAAAKTYGWNPDIGAPDGVYGPRTREAFRVKGFATGGLADFTGPAWLDGTKSRPEYVLNANQTQRFFELIDVLGALSAGKNITTQNTGDSTYDIDINVESIGSDYDVEQLADKVKRMINDDARYRNNNIAGTRR